MAPALLTPPVAGPGSGPRTGDQGGPLARPPRITLNALREGGWVGKGGGGGVRWPLELNYEPDGVRDGREGTHTVAVFP